MKKALVVFLILAVAGGLFAEFSFSGHAQTGIGFGWDDTDADGTLGLIRNRGESGLRIGFTFSGKVATEDYGTFSGSLGLRHSVNQFGGDSNGYSLVYFEDPRLTWVVPGSLGLTLGIGTGGPGGTTTPGDIDTNLTAGEGQGLAAQLKPITGLTLAASAIFGRPQTTLDKVVYAFGAKYSLVDLLDIAANVNYDQTKDDKEKINFAAGVSILPIVKPLGFTALAFDFRTNNGFGGDNSDIGIGERIGFAAGDLSLLLRARQLLWMGKDDDKKHDFIPMHFYLEAGYKVSGLVKVGIDGKYIIGSKPAFNFRNAWEMNHAGWTKDAAGLGISPYVAFSVGGPTITLGYNLQKDMSDPAPLSGTRSMQHLIYGQIHLSF